MHVEESIENSLSLDAIFCRLNTCMSKNSLSRTIRKVFKNVQVKRERSKDNWCERSIIYHGIFWRQTLPATEVLHFNETGNLQIPDDSLTLAEIATLRKDFFVIKEMEDKLIIGHLLHYRINSNRVLVEVTFESSLLWHISVCGNTNIMPHTVGLRNDFILTKCCILGNLEGISKMRMCIGIPCESAHTCNNLDVTCDTMEELFTCHSDDTSAKKIYRSLQCCRVISLSSNDSKSVCNVCKEIKDRNVKSTRQLERFPFKDLSNICHNTTKLENTVFNGDMSDTCTSNPSFCTGSIVTENNNSINEKGKSDINNTDNNTGKQLFNPNEQSTEPETLTLSETDDHDMSHIFEEVIKSSPPKVIEFLTSQQDALSRKPKGRRWNKNIIRICLTMWCRSPKCYKDLRDSGFMLLPSQRILQIYKNKIHQKPGINKELIQWMKNEALCRNLPPDGYEGGLMLDEMSIQSDLEFSSKDANIHLWGFKEVTDESKFIDSILSGKREICLATHVLQFVFLGYTGFRFPLFHFPTNQANASELYILFWKLVSIMSTFGFKVQYISMDGAQANRDFAKILLGTFKSNLIETMTVHNIFSIKQEPIFIIMDYSHLIKKIRNNINKSGKLDSYKRHLKFKGHFIHWEHFVNAYYWDISHNPFPIYHKLRQEHFQLTSDSKMRNSLAEDVLNKDMLHLMKCYADSLTCGSEHLKTTIELLEKTSLLIANFRDSRPIREIGDLRLIENDTVLQWFKEWESDILSDKDKEKHLISHQTRADICSLIIGFRELCEYRLRTSSCSIVPSRLNSDIIENVFCQQRGLHNGNNTNPTYLNYCRTMNTVILGQTTISRKSNAFQNETAAQPFSKNL